MREADQVSIGEDLRLALSNGGAAKVVRLEGSVDMYNASALERELREIERHLDERLMVLDLSGLDYLDGCGLDVLYKLQRRSGRDHFGLEFRSDSDNITRFLHTAGADDDLPFARPAVTA